MKCPNCGNEVDPSDAFCGVCGADLRNVDWQAQQNNANTQNNGNAQGYSNAQNQSNGQQTYYDGNYNPTPDQSPLGNLFANASDFTKIRRYFFGFKDVIIISVVLFVIFLIEWTRARFSYSYYYGGGGGGVWLFLTILALIGIIVGISLDIFYSKLGMGKTYTDNATNKAIEMFQKRALDRFNVDKSQVNEVEPIVVSGIGCAPNISVNGKFRAFKLFARYISKDPIQGFKLGIDMTARYMLVSTTVFAFTDSQLLIYNGNVDISTGRIYEETVREVYYNDVNGVAQTDIMKKLHRGFKKLYFNTKVLELDICGIKFGASFDERFTGNADASLAGMKSYIREKKSK
ncbi:MAG: zinc ribbon domain-containing protein [Lachnospiraceae bacterium]|nr:zinc ribbon domain-containing protein [Lachnospiraceae bacterium]